MKRVIGQSSRWLALHHAVPPSKRRTAIEFQRRCQHSFREHKPDVRNIPVIGERVHIPFENIEGTTITPRERDVFQRLFQDVINDATKNPADSTAQKLPTKGNRRGRTNVKTREELLESVAKFPEALREIALNSAERIEHIAWEAAQKAERDLDGETSAPIQDNDKVQENALTVIDELARIRGLYEAAASDLELWRIVEEELFQKVTALNLDEIVDRHESKPKRKGKKKATAPDENMLLAPDVIKDIASMSALYPAALIAAFQVFRERFPRSTLTIAILPQVKCIGRGSYALGASTALYHELLESAWHLTGDLLQVTTILEEMDTAGFDFNDDTYAIIRRISKHWQARLQKPLNKLERTVIRMGMINEEFDKLMGWRKIMGERIDAEALRKANQKINEHLI